MFEGPSLKQRETTFLEGESPTLMILSGENYENQQYTDSTSQLRSVICPLAAVLRKNFEKRFS